MRKNVSARNNKLLNVQLLFISIHWLGELVCFTHLTPFRIGNFTESALLPKAWSTHIRLRLRCLTSPAKLAIAGFRYYYIKELSTKKLDNTVFIFRLDLGDLMKQSRRRSYATLKTLWLKFSQRWPEDAMRDVQVICGQLLRGGIQVRLFLEVSMR